MCWIDIFHFFFITSAFMFIQSWLLLFLQSCLPLLIWSYLLLFIHSCLLLFIPNCLNMFIQSCLHMFIQSYLLLLKVLILCPCEGEQNFVFDFIYNLICCDNNRITGLSDTQNKLSKKKPNFLFQFDISNGCSKKIWEANN